MPPPCCVICNFGGCLMRRLSVLTIALWLAGCATYQARPVDPIATQGAFEQRSLADPGLRQFLLANGVALPGGDLVWDLSTLVGIALYEHPDLDVARAQWRVAEAAVRTAGQRPVPGVQVPLGNNASASDGLSPWLFGIAFEIPIETAGKRGHRIAQAQAWSRAARLRLAGVGWQVRSRVRERLLAEYAATQTQAMVLQQVVDYTEMLAMLDKRVALGEAAQPDAALVRVDLAQARVALAEAQRQQQDARMQLAVALGLPANALDGVRLVYDALQQQPDVPPPAARRAALQRRADLLAALAEYAASQAALQGEIAKQYPDIQLGPGYTWDQGDDKFTLVLSLPVLGFLSQRGPIAEAQARRTEAADRFLALQAQAIGELDRAAASVALARNQGEAADRLFAEQQRRLKQTERRLAAGETDRLDRVTVRLAAHIAERGARDAAIATQQALGALEDAMQQPLTSESLHALPVETNPRAASKEHP